MPNIAKDFDHVTIALQDGYDAENVLYRLKRDTVLHIHPASSLLGREIILYTNYQDDDKKQFWRTEYRVLNWQLGNGKKLTSVINPCVHVVDTDIYSKVKMTKSGTFRFYFQDNNSTCSTENGSLYVQVEPVLQIGPPTAPRTISLDSVRCQTFLSKCLGPLNTWEFKLRVAKETGYNVIHFTPIQELGGSQSSYSLRDQLKVSSRFLPGGNPTFEDVEKVIKRCREDWGIASICDIVLNHTANESDWIRDHPDGAYSCTTCPYLRPAYLLDAVFAKCGADVASGALKHLGIPPIINHESHLDALKYQLSTMYLPQVNIHEFYQCDITKIVNNFNLQMRQKDTPKNVTKEQRFKEVKLVQDPQYYRLNSNIDLELALDIFNAFHADCFDEEARQKKCSDALKHHLEILNENIRLEIQNYLNFALENCLASIRYERIQDHSSKKKKNVTTHPIFMQYFTHTIVEGKTLMEIEQCMYGKLGQYLMAHNGWVMNCSDPLKNFAEKQPGHGNVYLKRELIAWGDSVKLRYGKKPEDSPYLWKHMTKYVELTAKIFDGIRLDNCHSTPIHVAEYLLDRARLINPNLYVVAELFTNSDAIDNIFVNRLGITSLIREAQSAWNSHEEGRLVYRYGGDPVGAFKLSCERHLAPSIAHALIYDLTHDNPSPIEKRSVYDLLPTAALVSMACCATGSNRGYDELVPHHIHVVDEERQYQEWGKGVDFNTGILKAKRSINLLHGLLAEEGFSQVYVDQMDSNIVAVTRHSPTTHESIILIAHTAFTYPHLNGELTTVRPLRFEGYLNEIIFEAKITNKSDSSISFIKNEKFINGYKQYLLHLRENIPLTKSHIFKNTFTVDGNVTQLHFENFLPGSVVAIRVSLQADSRLSIDKLQSTATSLNLEKGSVFDELMIIMSKMSLVELNKVLFTCDAEERDACHGWDAYNIPGFGPIVYCGLQGFISILSDIAPYNDLGHPLCRNLREGHWLIDYIVYRFNQVDGTRKFSRWIATHFDALKQIPNYLIPCYFDTIVNGTYKVAVKKVLSTMPAFLRNGHSFSKHLALASIQFLSTCNSANLPKLSPALSPPLPPILCVTLSAGLPHFCTGYMRCWGRDTFIAMRGLMFLTGRFEESRYIILGFAQCLRHGLIPNLLDNGIKPRFNCRDAVWWWLYSIKQYVTEAPKGNDILKDKISRIFPDDNAEPYPAGSFDQLLYDVMQEALQVHFQGLEYRERGAGYDIDAHMKNKGFDNRIGVHPETGFVFGGNADNCGTWMDKMGSSEKAGNRGHPSTPRDGSAVELVGLQMSVLRFMQSLSEQGIIPYSSVEKKGVKDSRTIWTYKQWADRIQKNFEKLFFVSPNEKSPLANKRRIYKDSLGASQGWTDFQLRCNFPIAMVVAPELFDSENAWIALEQTKKYLLGPLGMKTLDPDDWNYRGNYENSNDSVDCMVAHGANYHQGPEWVWPMGYYLRARLVFAKKCGHLKETIAETWCVLQSHLKEIQTSPWRGLPELTNSNGTFCPDSCKTQAWSVASILEVLYELHSIGGDV